MRASGQHGLLGATTVVAAEARVAPPEVVGPTRPEAILTAKDIQAIHIESRQPVLTTVGFVVPPTGLEPVAYGLGTGDPQHPSLPEESRSTTFRTLTPSRASRSIRWARRITISLLH